MAARAALFSELESAPFYAGTGFGFDVIDVVTQHDRFGAFPILFYGYNAASALLTVLASEPRGGVFEFVERLWQEGPGPAPWQWVNVTRRSQHRPLSCGPSLGFPRVGVRRSLSRAPASWAMRV